MTKFTQNFVRRHLKENDMLKILAACHLGAPFQPGALRTCVPCLMVNPALRGLSGTRSEGSTVDEVDQSQVVGRQGQALGHG